MVDNIQDKGMMKNWTQALFTESSLYANQSCISTHLK